MFWSDCLSLTGYIMKLVTDSTALFGLCCIDKNNNIVIYDIYQTFHIRHNSYY